MVKFKVRNFGENYCLVTIENGLRLLMDINSTFTDIYHRIMELKQIRRK